MSNEVPVTGTGRVWGVSASRAPSVITVPTGAVLAMGTGVMIGPPGDDADGPEGAIVIAPERKSNQVFTYSSRSQMKPNSNTATAAAEKASRATRRFTSGRTSMSITTIRLLPGQEWAVST